ncbi:type II toxin-antitoxin system VapC family toxin [Pedobacter jejuensis]|uniref:Type II toxin-antitoxin system VapC family toxin n=1 Tax=Pedobacter jejuensis TaxID=1268550 RepID=A0A3N0BTF2_9SPHI|nr:type II toxin-antitoxin system VapC family toxin [Pedobacter jejuensis]RNL52298.1 type II toxin-antitoxin system VapC family toxin [Pedobacter jejuensis]
MANKIILIDTSILIDYFRKSDKINSKLIALFDKGYDFVISAITYYEIYSGANENQLNFWNKLLLKIDVLPFDEHAAKASVEINNELKKSRNQLAVADLFIAGTALSNNLSLATLNTKHFERIKSLDILNL